MKSELWQIPAEYGRSTDEAQLEERRWALLSAEGDAVAFRRLVERHHRGVYQFVLHIVGSAADAEDLVQDTFERALVNSHRFVPGDPWPRGHSMGSGQSRDLADDGARCIDDLEVIVSRIEALGEHTQTRLGGVDRAHIEQASHPLARMCGSSEDLRGSISSARNEGPGARELRVRGSQLLVDGEIGQVEDIGYAPLDGHQHLGIRPGRPQEPARAVVRRPNLEQRRDLIITDVQGVEGAARCEALAVELRPSWPQGVWPGARCCTRRRTPEVLQGDQAAPRSMSWAQWKSRHLLQERAIAMHAILFGSTRIEDLEEAPHGLGLALFYQ